MQDLLKQILTEQNKLLLGHSITLDLIFFQAKGNNGARSREK